MDYKQDFHERSKAKISETKFEEYLKTKNIRFKRFGWDYNADQIPGYEFIKLPEYMRALPDYIIFKKKSYFVEVKGCKNFLRLKLCDMIAYTFWNVIMDLYFFIYSSKTNKIYKLSFHDMNELTKYCKVVSYDDNNKQYFIVELEQLELKTKG